MLRRPALFHGSVASCLCALSSLSFAQPEASRPAGAVLEEIVVTAELREASLQDTPISIHAISDESLINAGITNVQELQTIAPSLVASGNRGSGEANLNVAIRGVGQRGSRATEGRGVGIYVDDVYYAVTYGSNMAFADVDRIEVLRGPQGTLFGRNNVGGAVRYFTKRPDRTETYGRVSAIVGEFNRTDYEAMLNLPISETLGARFVYSNNSRDGYQEWVDLDGQKTGREALGAREEQMFRGSLRFEPNESLTADLIFSYQDAWNNGTPNDAVELRNAGAGFSNPLAQAVLAETGVPLADNDPRLVTSSAFTLLDSCLVDGDGLLSTRLPSNGNPDNPINRCDTKQDSETYALTLNVTYDISDTLSFRSITGGTDIVAENVVDWSTWGGYFRVEQADVSFFSQEFQLAGTSLGSRLEWVTGVSYFDMTADQSYEIWAVDRQLNDYRDNVQAQNVDEDSWGIFAQGTYSITDQLNLTLGVRYTEEGKDFDVSRDNRIDGFLVNAGETWSDTNYRVSLDYAWTDQIMTYVSYSDAFKAGTFPTRLNQDGCNPALFGDPGICDDERELISNADIEPLDPEVVTNLEVGLRAEFFDRVRMNLTWFSMDYTDLQRRERTEDPSDPDCVAGGFEDGICEANFLPGSIDAKIDGIEAELLVALTDALSLNVNYSQINTEVTDNQGAPSLEIGDPLEQSPETNYAISLNHGFQFANGLRLSSSATYAYKDSYIPPFGGAGILTDPIKTLNARVQLASDNWSLALGGTNLTDESFEFGLNAWANFFGQLVQEGRAAPRSLYLQLTYDFGA